MKNILIIGNGGREYSIALHLRKDNRVKDIFFSPKSDAANMFLQAKGFSYNSRQELLQHIKDNNIHLVIIGPEAPLIAGIVDFLQEHNILCFGATEQNAKLEGSKAYMKDFVTNLNIPTAKYIEITEKNLQDGYAFIDNMRTNIVIKASGLCAGKGVIITHDKNHAKEVLNNMLNGNLFGDSGKCVVIEEFLDGYELSLFAISNAKSYTLLPPCQDHKRLMDNDKGPNTGGMGAYNVTSNNLYNKILESKIKDRILTPTFNALKNLGHAYKGVLFAGIMVVNGDPYLLEYNVRFGDPECEILMPLLKTPLLDIIESFAKEEDINIELYDKSAVCVVIASSDYALDSKSSDYPAKITFLKDIDNTKGHIIFANTTLKDGSLFANSGRVAVAVGIGNNTKEARDHAYEIANSITFTGCRYRNDIAYQSL